MNEQRPKITAVLPAYNAAKTLERTVRDIPKSSVDDILLVDDASGDETVPVAERLGLAVFRHEKNRGYGANQKTCYDKALERGADIVVMVHPDYQYDPKIVPQMIEPIARGEADAVFGSRMLRGGSLKGGMPLWKYLGNVALTALENAAIGARLSEYHCGYRAYSARLLRAVGYAGFSDGFVFDTEIIVQCALRGFRIREIPIQTRYFKEASTIGFGASVSYSLAIVRLMAVLALNRLGLRRDARFGVKPRREDSSRGNSKI
jgi:glycosyltransferase involved in cell wall biosynthesis